MFVFITQDLMILSSARSALPPGAVLKQAVSVQRLRELAIENEIRLLLVDLQTPGLKLEDLDLFLTESNLLSITVVFAQHVNVGMLDQAKTAVPECNDAGAVQCQVAEAIDGCLNVMNR